MDLDGSGIKQAVTNRLSFDLLHSGMEIVVDQSFNQHDKCQSLHLIVIRQVECTVIGRVLEVIKVGLDLPALLVKLIDFLRSFLEKIRLKYRYSK